MGDLLSYLKNSQLEIENTLERLVLAESPSHNKALVDKCGEVLKKEFQTLIGGTVEEFRQEEVGNLLRFEWGEGAEQVLIICHFDTVWDEGVLPYVKDAQRMWGPGTFDMKGGIAVSLWAIKTLKEMGLKGNRRVVLLCSTDEEIGSEHSRAIIEAEAAKSSYVLVPESSIPPYGAVKTQRKGVAEYILKIKGVSAHAGIEPEKGVSAIEELAHQILVLHSMTNIAEGVTVNVGVVSGGTRSNVTAEHAEAVIDVRGIRRDQLAEIDERIRHRVPRVVGTVLEVTGGINRYPLERTTAVEELYENAKAIAEKHGYSLQEGLSGGGSDGNLTAGLGIPTLDGLGPIGDGAHARHEHIVLENLPIRAALIAELLLTLINK